MRTVKNVSTSAETSSPQATVVLNPPTVAEINEWLGDKYEVSEVLGVGGMGVVYKGSQSNPDRLVAIKLLPPALDESGELSYSERFRREAKAMSLLDHPNIISLLEFGETKEGAPYFVMEFVDGSDLHTLIHAAKLELSHVVSWFPLICHALEHAHSKGIYHCDIKPANIMIAKDGRVKIADFGLVQLQADPAEGEKVLGTVGYSAPEIFEPKATVDHRADIFSLGILIYELLTGRIPEGEWIPPSQLNKAVDPRFDDLVLHCVQHNPNERFQSASHLSSVLTDIASNRLLPTQRQQIAKPSAALIAGGAVNRPARIPRRRAPNFRRPPSVKLNKAPEPKKKAPIRKKKGSQGAEDRQVA